jgi:hypothetical protein
MTHVEFMKKVCQIEGQYWVGAIMAAEGYNAVAVAVYETMNSLYPNGHMPELEKGEMLTFDEQGNRIVVNMGGEILRTL